MQRLLWFLLAPVLAAPSAWACSCLPPPPPAEERARATAVFVGKVVARQETGTGRQRTYEFIVTETFKGTLAETISVTSAADSATCGYNFTMGESYVVYAYGPAERLNTHLCTRNRDVKHAEADKEIAALRKAAKVSAQQLP